MKPFDYAAPRSLAEAVSLLEKHGERARPLAGGTDILVQLREHRREVELLVDVKQVPEANELSYVPDRGLRIGAAVPCCRIYEDAVIAAAYPGLIDAVSLVGGIQIQSRASLGGNLCNASPAADTVPALIVHEAVCLIAGPQGTRELPVEQFCTGPGKTVLRGGEFLVSFWLPAPRKRSAGAYLRFIPRNEMDIAVVGVGVRVTLDEGKSRCSGARIALAAVAPTPLLVPEASAALVNGPLSDALIDRAAAAAQAAARPISDMRGTAEFRRHLVGVLTRRAIRLALDRAEEN